MWIATSASDALSTPVTSPVVSQQGVFVIEIDGRDEKQNFNMIQGQFS